MILNSLNIDGFMQFETPCHDCIKNAAERALVFLNLEDKKRHDVIGKVEDYLRAINPILTPMELSFGMFEIIQQETGIADPLKSLKTQSNLHALELFSKAKDTIFTSNDPLFTAIQVAIAGNIIDFGIKSEYNLSETLEEVLKKNPFINDYELLKQKLSNAKTLTFLADNAGEIVFDKLLLEQLLSQYSLKKTYLIVKKYPFGNDIILEDIGELGFEEIPGLEIVALDNLSSKDYTAQIKHYTDQTDVTISKGQGNFELLYDRKLGLFFLFIVKCKVVKRILQSEIGDILIAFQ